MSETSSTIDGRSEVLDPKGIEVPPAPENVSESSSGAEEDEAIIPERAQRRRAQAAEAERDALAETLHRVRVAEVHRLAADRVAVPGDLFDFGLELDEVLTEDGLIDPDKVSEAIDVVLETRPGLAAAQLIKGPRPIEYKNSGQNQPTRKPTGKQANWQQVFGGEKTFMS